MEAQDFIGASSINLLLQEQVCVKFNKNSGRLIDLSAILEKCGKIVSDIRTYMNGIVDLHYYELSEEDVNIIYEYLERGDNVEDTLNHLNVERLINILYVAEQEDMIILKIKLMYTIYYKILPDEAFAVLELCRENNLNFMERLVWMYLDIHAHEVIWTRCFLELETYKLKEFLRRPTLNVCEFSLAAAVNGWITNKMENETIPDTTDNRQHWWKFLLPLIRFPIMSRHELINFVKHWNIMPPAMFNEILRMKADQTYVSPEEFDIFLWTNRDVSIYASDRNFQKQHYSIWSS